MRIAKDAEAKARRALHLRQSECMKSKTAVVLPDINPVCCRRGQVINADTAQAYSFTVNGAAGFDRTRTIIALPLHVRRDRAGAIGGNEDMY